jgi:hypothetical protein
MVHRFDRTDAADESVIGVAEGQCLRHVRCGALCWVLAVRPAAHESVTIPCRSQALIPFAVAVAASSPRYSTVTDFARLRG